MASLMEELIAVMGEEEGIYKELVELSRPKRDAIIYKRLDELNSIGEKEQEIASRLKERESRRTHIMGSMATVMGQDGKELTISWMIDKLASRPNDARRLKEARDALVKAADEMKFENTQVQRLLTQAMEMVEYDMTLLKSVRQAPQTANYNSAGVGTGELLGSSGFDAKQ